MSSQDLDQPKLVVEWIDANNVPQFRILSEIAARSYENYLLFQGLEVHVYAA